ncbi:MAG TPA: zinc-dependent metalloprotease family protein [Thermoanaerobaculia bacterium]|nr:zinc-dependent metalloprotease family protein [Thermoanaerobaculia bacterium]
MRSKSLILCGLLLCLGGLPAAAGEAPRGDLFRFLDREASRDVVSVMSAVAGREILAERRIAVDASVLASVVKGPFRMRLLDERDYDMEATEIERRGPASFAWRGKVVDPVLGEVGTATLTVMGDLMAGFVVMADALYEIEPGAPGEHRLLQVENAVESCGGAILPEIAPKSPQQRQAARIAAQAEARVAESRIAAGLAAPVRLDLLAIWTPEARVGLGGSRQILLDVQSAVDVANTSFANSQIDARLNLVHSREMKIPETGNPEEDLVAFRENREVAALRKSVGADLVSLFVLKMNGACGIGYLMAEDGFSKEFQPFAYSVVKRLCGPLVLAHEVGHNMAANHDRPNAGNADIALFPFAFGHTVNGQFRTVMAYNTNCFDCPWVENFSNPNVSRNGHATGVAGQSDNAQVLNATKGLTSTYLSLPLQACKKGTNNLCLLKNRFRVELFWENQFNNTQGVGTAVPRSDAAGFFSFGDSSNLELMVKLLNFGDVVKVFYGQLTNLKFNLIVTDTHTGASKVYENTPRECGGIDQAAFAGLSASLALATGPSMSGVKAAAATCKKDKNTLCLLNNRFAVNVDWRNPGNGTSGTGGAVPVSGVTGAFYFTDAGNLELMAKVIDYGDRIDFFYGTLSDLEYTITVTDTNTGQAKTYHNAAGSYCGGLDGGAFPR